MSEMQNRISHSNQAEPDVRNKRVTPVGLSGVLHHVEHSPWLVAVNNLQWQQGGLMSH